MSWLSFASFSYLWTLISPQPSRKTNHTPSIVYSPLSTSMNLHRSTLLSISLTSDHHLARHCWRRFVTWLHNLAPHATRSSISTCLQRPWDNKVLKWVTDPLRKLILISPLSSEALGHPLSANTLAGSRSFDIESISPTCSSPPSIRENDIYPLLQHIRSTQVPFTICMRRKERCQMSSTGNATKNTHNPFNTRPNKEIN